MSTAPKLVQAPPKSVTAQEGRGRLLRAEDVADITDTSHGGLQTRKDLVVKL